MIFQVIGIILGTLVGLFILELAIVALIPGFSAPEQRLETNEQAPKEVNEDSFNLRKDVSFEVKETIVSAWLYLPDNSTAPYPCIIIRGDKYRPVEHAPKVRCPVLLQICEHDSLTPKSAAEETVNQLGKYAEPIYYPIGHFDIYNGENFDRSVNDQLKFFNKYLSF